MNIGKSAGARRPLRQAHGTIGNGVRIPDRTAAVRRRAARKGHWRKLRRPRGAMMPSQKTCLRSKYRFLRPKERYVPQCARREWRVRAVLYSVLQRDISANGRYILFFSGEGRMGAAADWYPAVARECGSRRLAGSAVPENRQSIAAPPARDAGSGRAGNPKTEPVSQSPFRVVVRRALFICGKERLILRPD